MKLKYVIVIVIVAFFCIESVYSQIIPAIQRVSLSENDKTVIDQYISEYATFTLDKEELITNLYSSGEIQFRLIIDEELDWIINLELNDMRAPGYKQIYTTDDGEFDINNSFIVNTFKGMTSDNRVVRFTIDENNFFGVILYDNYHYIIRYVNEYTQSRNDNSLIVYRSSDIILNDNDFNYINVASEITEDLYFQKDNSKKIKDDFASSNLCKYYLKIATDADYQYYQAKSSNVGTVNSSILSILNIVEGVYESTFNIKFLVTEQFVMTTNVDYTSTSAPTLLQQFQDYWNYHRQGVNRNIAHLFTGKTLNGGIKGYSNIGVIDNKPMAYGLSMNHTRTPAIVAHEIAHNLSAGHAFLSDCGCSSINSNDYSIMCDELTTATNLWFCSQSIGQINSYIATRINSLEYYTLPVYNSGTSTTIYAPVINVKNTEVKSGAILELDARSCGGSVKIDGDFKVESGATFIIR